jgi:hypothetical protein
VPCHGRSWRRDACKEKGLNRALSLSRSMRCQEHQQEQIGTCIWCSRAVCHICAEKASGKKLCAECYMKFSSSGLASQIRKTRSSVQNKDPSLTTDRIASGKVMIEQQSAVRPRVKNVPDR